MATIWERLFGSRQQRDIARQLQDMQQVNTDLLQYNNQLNQLLNIQFRNQGGFTRFDTIQQVGFIRDGYNVNAYIYALVSDIASRGASVPLVCYEIIDDVALKNYRAAMSQKNIDLFTANQFKTKALRAVDYANPIQKLIDRPNNDDNTDTFYETSIGFTCLTGNNYWYAPTLDMGADKGKIMELRIMPSQFVGLVVVQGFPSRVIGYELIIDGVRLMQSAEVAHMRYPNYDWSVDGQEHYGLPPLKAGWNTLALDNAAETSMISMFNNGGPRMIVTNESLEPSNTAIEQLGKIKKLWNDEYSGSTNRNKIKLSAGKINAIPLDMSPVDMDIIAADKHARDKIAAIFHYSSIMLNDHSASTESNVKEMRKDCWVRGVLPLRKMHCDVFNSRIVPAHNGKNGRFFVDMDLSGISDLQPDRKTQADWLSVSWWIPPNRKLEIQGEEKSLDPNMDKVYAPSSLVALDDLNIEVPELEPIERDGIDEDIDMGGEGDQ